MQEEIGACNSDATSNICVGSLKMECWNYSAYIYIYIFKIFLYSSFWEADKSNFLKIFCWYACTELLSIVVDCCHLVSISLILFTCLSLSLSHNPQDDFFVHSSVSSPAERWGCCSGSRAPLGALTFIFFVLEVGLKVERSLIPFACQAAAGSPCGRPCPPWLSGLWESSRSSWGCCCCWCC